MVLHIKIGQSLHTDGDGNEFPFTYHLSVMRSRQASSSVFSFEIIRLGCNRIEKGNMKEAACFGSEPYVYHYVHMEDSKPQNETIHMYFAHAHFVFFLEKEVIIANSHDENSGSDDFQTKSFR